MSQDKAALVPLPKKRPWHSWQQHIPSSARFALDAGEDISLGPRTSLEVFALEQALAHCVKQAIPPTCNNIAMIYNAMCEVIFETQSKYIIRNMNLEQVATFLREHEHNQVLYKSMCLSYLYQEMEKCHAEK